MDSLKPKPLASEIVPGFFVVVCCICFIYFSQYKSALLGLITTEKINTLVGIISGFGMLLLMWFIGAFLDAIRTVWFEVNIFKGIKDEDWDFFFKAPSEAIEKLEENYYASYRLDVNLSLSILLVGIIEALCLIFGAFSFNVPIGIVDIILIIFLIFFLRDGYVLWRDMKRFLKEWRQTKEAITNANK